MLRWSSFQTGRVIAASGALTLASCLISGTAFVSAWAKSDRAARFLSGRMVLARSVAEAKTLGTYRATGRYSITASNTFPGDGSRREVHPGTDAHTSHAVADRKHVRGLIGDGRLFPADRLGDV